MDLLSRHSWLYQSVVGIPSYVRYTITVGLAVLLLLIWWYVLYTGTRGNVRLAYSEIGTLQKKETDLIAARTAVDQLEQEIELLEQKISGYRPSNKAHAQQDQLVSILNTAAGAGLSLNGYAITAQKDKGWYLSQVVATELSGSYDQLLKFLTGIKECQKMIQCNQFQCTLNKSGDCVVSAQLKMTVPVKAPITELQQS